MESERTAGRAVAIDALLMDGVSSAMPESVRDCIRSAQEAELRGDKTAAVELLLKAASLYEDSGHIERAMQMLRNAQRLEPGRTDVVEQIARLESHEATPVRPLSPKDIKMLNAGEEDQEEVDVDASLPSGELELAAREALESMEAGETDLEAKLSAELDRELDSAFDGKLQVEVDLDDDEENAALRRLREAISASSKERRVNLGEYLRPPPQGDEHIDEPELAPSSDASTVSGSEAWCSFCCKPISEVGKLVAGSTGSFICAGCVAESMRDLNVGASRVSPELLSGGPLLGQEEGVRAVQGALAEGRSFVLLVGPPGCGKSLFLREAASRGLGERVATPEDVLHLRGNGALLVDDGPAFQDVAQTVRSALDRRAAPVLLAATGTAPEALWTLEDGDSRAYVYSSEALVAATAGRVSRELAERVDAVAIFRPLEVEALQTLAQRFVQERAEATLPEAFIRSAVEHAARSGRGAHELAALLGRVPAGAWKLPSAKSLKPSSKVEKNAKAAKPAKTAVKKAPAQPKNRGRR
jgi:hypothetical protein